MRLGRRAAASRGATFIAHTGDSGERSRYVLTDLVRSQVPTTEVAEEKKGVAAVQISVHSASEMAGDDVYDGEGSRSFYEVLPDLRAVLPAVVFDTATQTGDEKAFAKLMKELPSKCTTREQARHATASQFGRHAMVTTPQTENGHAVTTQVDAIASELCVAGLACHVDMFVTAMATPPDRRALGNHEPFACIRRCNYEDRANLAL